MLTAIRKKWYQWKSFKENLKNRSPFLFHGLDFVEGILFAVIAVLFLRMVAIQTSLIPTGSMIPTLQIRDRLFVDKLTYHWSDPKRGDIVVFKSPLGDGKEYVKRCVGLPGETIEIKKGRVYINGLALILPGVILRRDFSNFPATQIPDHHYFVLGDNRAFSSDSRFWGFVSRDHIRGKAWYTFWPFKHMRMLR